MLHISNILSFSLLLIPLAFSKTEFTVTLDSQDKFNVTWSYDGKSKDDYITFTVSSGDNIIFNHDLCSKGTAWITVVVSSAQRRVWNLLKGSFIRILYP